AARVIGNRWSGFEWFKLMEHDDGGDDDGDDEVEDDDEVDEKMSKKNWAGKSVMGLLVDI
ncbi:hypothetical protein Tco_1196813, partial [Tanacetum coccineum]